jgi:phospholipid/cholesterol/gamma-HCH transport system substrate-binding protein
MAGRDNAPYQISSVDRLVGLVIVVALILLAVVVVRHFRETAPAHEALAYHTLLTRSYGIAKGADIRLAGISVGKVESIGLEKSGQVRIDFHIDRDYRRFVTRGSYLKIASTMGLAAIMELTKLNFVSNAESSALLPPGSRVDTAEPVDLADTLSADEIAILADNVKAIIANLAMLSRTMARNQELISSSLSNVGEITMEIRDSVRSLPDIVDSATTGFAAWEKAGTDLYTVIDDVSGDVRQVGTNSVKASDKIDAALGELHRLIAQLNTVMQRMQEGADQVPLILSEARALIQGANRLTERLNRHWLLGGEAPKKPMFAPSIHPVGEPMPPLEDLGGDVGK